MNCLRATLLVAAALAVPATAAERSVEKTALIPAPIDAVWTAWTTTDGIKSFLAPDAKVELRVDGPFEIYFNPYGAPGQKGADDMRILAFQDRRMISFTWNAPPHLPEVRSHRTHVTVRFVPSGDKETEVTIHHDGWGDGGQWDQAFTYFDKAWGSVLANLQKRFVEQKPIDWSPFLERLKPK
jgi:uncharacterized protein YndB with AHSA1/START domain